MQQGNYTPQSLPFLTLHSRLFMSQPFKNLKEILLFLTPCPKLKVCPWASKQHMGTSSLEKKNVQWFNAAMYVVAFA